MRALATTQRQNSSSQKNTSYFPKRECNQERVVIVLLHSLYLIPWICPSSVGLSMQISPGNTPRGELSWYWQKQTELWFLWKCIFIYQPSLIATFGHNSTIYMLIMTKFITGWHESCPVAKKVMSGWTWLVSGSASSWVNHLLRTNNTVRIW